MTAVSVLQYASLDSPVLYHQGRIITLSELLLTVDYLAEKIPPHRHLLNLYEDRYHFLLGLLLSLKQQSLSLFPSTITPHVLSQLQNHYRDILVLAQAQTPYNDFEQCAIDDLLQTPDFQHHLKTAMSQRRPEQAITAILPSVAPDREVAILFTSGSTGQPQPYAKQWRDLTDEAQLLAEQLLFAEDGPASTAVIATVPAQHMYGLEVSIFMAIQNGLLIHSDKPFFPQDISQCLADLANLRDYPAPKPAATVITTPLHLKACIKTGVSLPGVAQFVSATAPLDKELAHLCETRYSARVMEIFGCTEVGSIAWRRTTASAQWTVLDDISLTTVHTSAIDTADQHIPSDERDDVQINSRRSIKQFLLNDIIERIDERHFLLQGRKEDLINLAGKRTSLGYLNHHLLSYENLMDGCFYQEDARLESRLVAFVVLPALQRQQLADSEISEKQVIMTLRAFLKNKIEAVFLPKTIYFVDALPRNATGKLPLTALRKLLQQLREQ